MSYMMYDVKAKEIRDEEEFREWITKFLNSYPMEIIIRKDGDGYLLFEAWSQATHWEYAKVPYSVLVAAFSEDPEIYDALLHHVSEFSGTDKLYGEKIKPVLKVLGILAGVEDFLDMGVDLSIYGRGPTVSLKSVTFVLGTGGNYITVYPNGLIEYSESNVPNNVSITDRELAELVYDYVENILSGIGLRVND